MPEPRTARPLLVLGILPSDATLRSKSASANPVHARRTWLAHAAALQVTARFVFPAPHEELSNPHHRTSRRGQRRLRVEPPPPTGDDVLLLPTTSACVCAELTHAWFSHSLAAWPAASFIGKTEDDVFIALPALRFELGRLVGYARDALWWGLMAWTGNGDIGHQRTGCWAGGFEDDPVLSAKGVRPTLGKERAESPSPSLLWLSPRRATHARQGAWLRPRRRARPHTSALPSCLEPFLGEGVPRRCPARHAGADSRG